MWFLVLLPLFIGTKAQFVSQNGDKCSRGFMCPPEFLRLNQNCYYFSKNISTWDEAFFTCQDLHGRLAILRNADQDRSMRSFLTKVSLVSVERWIGGRYDWEQMTWKWGQSGREIKYRGFSRMDPDDKEKLQWHCIVLDPELQYKWNARSCLEQKHFICQTKIKPIPVDEELKLRRKLNKKVKETYKHTNYKEYTPKEVDEPYPKHRNSDDDRSANEVLSDASYAFTNNTAMEIAKSHRPKSKRYNRQYMLKDGTVVIRQANRKRKNHLNKTPSQDEFHTKIYYGGVPKSPLHPRVLTEEFGFR